MSATRSRHHELSRRQLLLDLGAAGTAVLGLMLTGCSVLGPSSNLVCRHQRSGKIYAEFRVAEGAEITLSWIHSIELSRWTEIFRFRGDHLMLVATRFRAYGAGTPMNEGDVRLEDGQVVIENIDRQFDAIRWIHSHRVDYRIGIGGDEDLVNTSRLPDQQPLELRPRG